jgi:hypothetical protein
MKSNICYEHTNPKKNPYCGIHWHRINPEKLSRKWLKFTPEIKTIGPNLKIDFSADNLPVTADHEFQNIDHEVKNKKKNAYKKSSKKK